MRKKRLKKEGCLLKFFFLITKEYMFSCLSQHFKRLKTITMIKKNETPKLKIN